MPKLTVGDADINYYLDDFTDPWVESGVILMHHGYCRNSKFWYTLVPSLARRYKVLRFDVRGCGESSAPPEGYAWSAEQLAKDALGLIDKLGIQKVTWVGEASGGVIGMLFTVSYPNRVNGLILCGTPFKMSNKLESDFQQKGFQEWSTRTMDRRIDKSRAEPGLLQWYISEYAKTPEHVAAALNRVFARADVPSLVAGINRLKVPTLVLAGAKGPVAGADQQRLMKEHLPHARFEIFDDIGEGFHLLIPDRCTKAMLAFLEVIDRGTPDIF